MAVHQLARGRQQCDIAGLERNRSAACTDAEHAIVLDHDRFLVETGDRPPYEWTILDLCEPFFKNRRLDLSFVPELCVGPKEAVIGFAERTKFLWHRKSSMRFDQSANRIDLRIGQAGGQPNATHSHPVTCSTVDYLVARFALGVSVVEEPIELASGEAGV